MGWEGAAISVQYFGGTEDRPACAYDYQPLEAIVAEHFDFFDLTMAEPGGEELAMLVLTQPGRPGSPGDVYQRTGPVSERQPAAGLPTILIDAGNGTYGTAFHKALTDQAELGWLLSYAGFLDMAIVTGTALSHGVARYAFLQHGEQTDATEQAFGPDLGGQHSEGLLLQEHRAQRHSELCPERPVRQCRQLLDAGHRPGGHPGAAGGRHGSGRGPGDRNLERSNFISSLSATREYAERGWGGVELTGYGFPWDRAFEISMEIRLGAFTEPHKALLGIYYK